MKFLNFEELEIIYALLEDEINRLSERIKEWEELKWDNLGGMQNMFLNKESFKQIRKDNIKNWKEQMQEMNTLQDKIEKYMNEE